MKKLTLILFVTLFILSSTVFAATSWVDPSYNSTNTGGHTWQVDAFSNITSAVSATSAGSIIYVAYGTYNEAIRINKSLTLSGNMSMINSPIYEAFYVSGNNVIITGFNLTNLPNGAITSAGDNLAVNNNLIQNSTLNNGYYLTKFTESIINPIYGGPTSGTNRVYHPFVIHAGSTYHFWYGDGANLRYTNSTNRNLSDAIFPGTIITSLNASQPYKFSAYYNAAGWDLGGNHYTQPFLMYYTDAVGSWNANPKISVSNNGLNWTFVAQTTGFMNFPVGYTATLYRVSVIYEGPNQWKAWGDNGNAMIQFYNSTNGINWTGVAGDILYKSNATYIQSWWETSGIGQISPNVIKVNGVYLLYYSAGTTTNDNAIGAAISKDGKTFVKYQGNPIFSKFDGVAWRNDRTYNPYVMQDTDGNWYMYIMGRSSVSTNYSVGIAQMNIAGLINASQNFWGTEDGPFSSSFLGTILYCPWSIDTTFSQFTCSYVPPRYSSISTTPSSPQPYNPIQNYTFNISWIDGSGISSAWLNFGGINYSMTNNNGQYSYNLFGITTNQYSFWANDTRGAINQTSTFTYLITTTPICTMNYSQTSPIDYNTAMIVSCSCTNNETAATLTINLEDISSRIGISTVYPAGNNLFQCSTPATISFNPAQTNSTFTINQISAIPIITSSLGWNVTEGSSTTINCTTNGNVVPTLYKDGSYTGANFQTLIPTIGTYNYVCNYTSNGNYSYAESYGMLTVTAATHSNPPTGNFPAGVSYIIDSARQANVTQNLTTPVSTTLTSPTPDQTGLIIIGGAFAGLLWFLVKG